MSIVMEILEGLWNIRLSYKGVPTRALFLSIPWENNKNSYTSTLHRMRKNGLIDKENGNWMITKSGVKYFKENKNLLSFSSPFQKTSPKNLLLMFDVPESRQNERKWLRLHLKRFHYAMIQKSVWVGPSPLPENFIAYLKALKLDIYIKTFKLAKPYPFQKKPD